MEWSFDLTTDDSSTDGSEVNFDIGSEQIPRVELAMDRNAIHSVCASAISRGISSRDVLHVITPFVQQNGGNIEKINISQSTIQRHQKKSAQSGAAAHREKVLEAINATDLPIIGLYDGKTIKEITAGEHLKRERLGILCSIEGEIYLLGIPAIPSSSGEHQLIALTDMFLEYQMIEKLAAVVVDTTGSNTGPVRGSVARLEKDIGEALILLACRRHVNERHIFHFWENVSAYGKTTSPSNPMFVKLLKNWNNIRLNIDPNKLNRLTLPDDGVLKDQAKKATRFYEKILEDNVFERDEYREMAELGLMILDPTKVLKFYRPCEPNSARFLNSGLNYQKLFLLKTQFPEIISQKEKEEVEIMGEFTSIFYGYWFLTSALTTQAPVNDITTYWMMKQYAATSSNPKIRKGAVRVMKSIEDHSWYVEEDLLPLSLLDDQLSDIEKELLAHAIKDTPVPESFPPRNRNQLPKMSTRANFNLSFPPSVCEFVGPYCWLMFKKLEQTDPDSTMWMQMKSTNWHKHLDYQKFKRFAKTLPVVNDGSERSVQLMSDFINNVHNEEDRQDLVVATSNYRNMLRGKHTKKDLAAVYSKALF